jgi:hypothetical protein
MIGAPIFRAAHTSPTPLHIVSNGSGFRLVGIEGDWYRVEFDDPGSGRRVGFVERKYATVKSTEATGLEPVDLSIHDSSGRKLEPVDLSIKNPKTSK